MEIPYSSYFPLRRNGISLHYLSHSHWQGLSYSVPTQQQERLEKLHLSS